MTRCDVIVSAAATKDLDDCGLYIARDNRQAALLFGDEVADAIDRLRDFPELGHIAHKSLRAIRVSERFKKYMIYYRLLPGPRIRVVRVLHNARDISRLL